MAVEIFVFDGDQGIAQHRREIVVGRDYASLQSEGTNHAAAIVVEFSDGTGTVIFQRVNLGQVGGVDQQQSGGRPYQSRDQYQQAEQDAAHDPASADFDRRKIFVERLHARMRSG